MIPVRKLRELVLDPARDTFGPAHISAASSLVQIDDTLYVIADDEIRLGVFERLGERPGYALPILEGRLDDEGIARKEDKADLESLTPMPAFGRFRDGVLFALGSGSSERRNRGVIVPLDRRGRPLDERRMVDLTPLYEELEHRVEQLNIEGAAVVGRTLRLLQRGNNGTGANARVELDLDGVCARLATDEPLDPSLLVEVVEEDLGQLHGVKLCFSDASALADGSMVFAASAEDTTDSYEDGEVLGSALGVIDPHGDVIAAAPVDVKDKIEGLTARRDGGRIHALLVTDADDPDKPSPLLEARF